MTGFLSFSGWRRHGVGVGAAAGLDEGVDELEDRALVRGSEGLHLLEPAVEPRDLGRVLS